MVNRHYFSDYSPEGRDPLHRIKQAGYCSAYCGSWGENIAGGTGSYATPRSRVGKWMSSASHRANILNPKFNEIGVGVVFGVPENSNANPSGTFTQAFGSLG